jgi:hypothetical protein
LVLALKYPQIPYTCTRRRSSQDDVVGSSPRGSSYPASVAVAVAVALEYSPLEQGNVLT